MAESEIVDLFRQRSRENGDGYTSFLGAGAYYHYRPVIIDSLISRGEFLTAYTPYQAEISQGTLQAIFEFQTMICELTGMEVANASMYDGSTAAAEGVMMAVRLTGRRSVVVARSLHPEYREVLATYAQHQGMPLNVTGFTDDGRLDLTELEKCDHAGNRLRADPVAELLRHDRRRRGDRRDRAQAWSDAGGFDRGSSLAWNCRASARGRRRSPWRRSLSACPLDSVVPTAA